MDLFRVQEDPSTDNLDMTKGICKLCRKEYAFKGKICLLCTCIFIVERRR